MTQENCPQTLPSNDITIRVMTRNSTDWATRLDFLVDLFKNEKVEVIQQSYNVFELYVLLDDGSRLRLEPNKAPAKSLIPLFTDYKLLSHNLLETSKEMGLENISHKYTKKGFNKLKLIFKQKRVNLILLNNIIEAKLIAKHNELINEWYFMSNVEQDGELLTYLKVLPFGIKEITFSIELIENKTNVKLITNVNNITHFNIQDNDYLFNSINSGSPTTFNDTYDNFKRKNNAEFKSGFLRRLYLINNPKFKNYKTIINDKVISIDENLSYLLNNERINLTNLCNVLDFDEVIELRKRLTEFFLSKQTITE